MDTVQKNDCESRQLQGDSGQPILGHPMGHMPHVPHLHVYMIIDMYMGHQHRHPQTIHIAIDTTVLPAPSPLASVVLRAVRFRAGFESVLYGPFRVICRAIRGVIRRAIIIEEGALTREKRR